jgi:hypothetical protein
MRPKLQKQSALKLAGRIIPLTKLSGTDTINNTPKLALGFIHMDLSRSFCPGSCANRGGAPPTGVGGPKIYLRLKEPKDTYATSRSRRRIHPPTKSGAFCVVGKSISLRIVVNVHLLGNFFVINVNDKNILSVLSFVIMFFVEFASTCIKLENIAVDIFYLLFNQFLFEEGSCLRRRSPN